VYECIELYCDRFSGNIRGASTESTDVVSSIDAFPDGLEKRISVPHDLSGWECVWLRRAKRTGASHVSTATILHSPDQASISIVPSSRSTTDVVAADDLARKPCIVLSEGVSIEFAFLLAFVTRLAGAGRSVMSSGNISVKCY
jgi:hypothetical protein